MGKLTGETRHRAQRRLFRKPLLVLQVQVERRSYPWGDLGRVWIDATVEAYSMLAGRLALNEGDDRHE